MAQKKNKKQQQIVASTTDIHPTTSLEQQSEEQQQSMIAKQQNGKEDKKINNNFTIETIDLSQQPMDWNVQQVQKWLSNKHFSIELMKTFKEQEIDGLSLFYLQFHEEQENFLKIIPKSSVNNNLNNNLNNNELNLLHVGSIGELMHLKFEIKKLFENVPTHQLPINHYSSHHHHTNGHHHFHPSSISTNLSNNLNQNYKKQNFEENISSPYPYISTSTGGYITSPVTPVFHSSNSGDHLNVINHVDSNTSINGANATEKPFSWSSSNNWIQNLLPDLKFMNEEEKEAWASMITKVFVSFGYFVFSIWCTAFTMVAVHERVPKNYPPLPDIVLDNVPLIPVAFQISELIAVILGSILFLIVILHKHRGIIVRRFFIIVGSVFLLRCCTMFITSLSVPGKHLTEDCMKNRGITTTFEEKFYRACQIAFGFGMSIMGVKTCGDYMFSGHMSVITILNYFINEYTPKNLKGLHIIAWVLNSFGAFFVLSSHEHYSIDVFIGFYISSRLFVYYHDMANMRHFLQRHRVNIGYVYIPLFNYLEEPVDGIVKNEYISIPFFSDTKPTNKRIEHNNSNNHIISGSGHQHQQ
ncbi:hypothetical protein ABK040_012337 [Willaertia magna]